MMKRVLPILLILLLALAAVLYFTGHRKQITGLSLNEALKIVPEDAVWILESQSVPELLKALIQSDPLFPAVQQIGNIQPQLLAFRKIDSLITRNSGFREIYANRPVVVSFHQTGKNLYQFLLILENHGISRTTGAVDLFTELCGHPGQWSDRIYNGQKINRISFGVDALIPGISMAENKNYLVISPSPILLENAVRQMSQENGLYNTPAFGKLSHTTGKSALAHIYINLKAFPAWLSGWMNPAVKRKMEMFTRYGDWASLDLTIRNDAIWMNGFALEGDTLNSYLNLFKNQLPLKLEAEKYLPSNTAVYYTIGIEKPALYLKDLSDYLGSGESGRRRQGVINKAAAASGADILKEWADLGFKELTIGYLCGVADQSIQPVALIQVKNGNQATEKLLLRGGSETVTKTVRQLAVKKMFRVDNQTEYAIYSVPFEGLPEILGGSFFSSVTGKYFACIANTLILADEIQTLEGILHKFSLNKTLANDAVYLSLASLMSTRSNVAFFAVPLKSRPLLEEMLNPAAWSGFLANDQFLIKTGAVGLQFSSGNGLSLHNLFASFAEIDYSKPQTIWESSLDARVINKPVIVTNHITRDKEIIVQDESANLYLINSSGRILWKKSIGERINSEIFQVDVMKNGKLQYLFSTENAIHLLDRNGTYLPKYPLKLKLPATNGMALIDFDHNRDYRILVACSDDKIYAFDKSGNPLKGWKFGPASGPITQPVQCFKIQNKDYLVFADPLKVYILDRKGSVKVKPEKDFAVSPNNLIGYEGTASGKGPRFIMTDIDGLVYTIFLDGSVETKKIGEFSPDHFFTVEDVNNDGLSEFVFIDRNKLEIYSQSGEKLNSRKFNGNVDKPPVFFLLEGNQKRIGLTVPSKNEVNLFNSDGTLYDGFPLYGQTSFTIGKLEQASAYRNLLVGSDEAYLYNYAIK